MNNCPRRALPSSNCRNRISHLPAAICHAAQERNALSPLEASRQLAALRAAEVHSAEPRFLDPLAESLAVSSAQPDIGNLQVFAIVPFNQAYNQRRRATAAQMLCMHGAGVCRGYMVRTRSRGGCRCYCLPG